MLPRDSDVHKDLSHLLYFHSQALLRCLITDIILTILSFKKLLLLKLLCWERTLSLRVNLLFGRIIYTIWYFIHQFVCLCGYFHNSAVLTQLKELQRLLWARLSTGFRSVSVGVGAHSSKTAKCEVRRRRWAGKSLACKSARRFLPEVLKGVKVGALRRLIPSLRTKLDNYFVQLNAGRYTRSAWPASWWQKRFSQPQLHLQWALSHSEQFQFAS